MDVQESGQTNKDYMEERWRLTLEDKIEVFREPNTQNGSSWNKKLFFLHVEHKGSDNDLFT